MGPSLLDSRLIRCENEVQCDVQNQRDLEQAVFEFHGMGWAEQLSAILRSVVRTERLVLTWCLPFTYYSLYCAASGSPTVYNAVLVVKQVFLTACLYTLLLRYMPREKTVRCSNLSQSCFHPLEGNSHPISSANEVNFLLVNYAGTSQYTTITSSVATPATVESTTAVQQTTRRVTGGETLAGFS